MAALRLAALRPSVDGYRWGSACSAREISFFVSEAVRVPLGRDRWLSRFRDNSSHLAQICETLVTSLQAGTLTLTDAAGLLDGLKGIDLVRIAKVTLSFLAHDSLRNTDTGLRLLGTLCSHFVEFLSLLEHDHRVEHISSTRLTAAANVLNMEVRVFSYLPWPFYGETDQEALYAYALLSYLTGYISILLQNHVDASSRFAFQSLYYWSPSEWNRVKSN